MVNKGNKDYHERNSHLNFSHRRNRCDRLLPGKKDHGPSGQRCPGAHPAVSSQFPACHAVDGKTGSGIWPCYSPDIGNRRSTWRVHPRTVEYSWNYPVNPKNHFSVCCFVRHHHHGF